MAFPWAFHAFLEALKASLDLSGGGEELRRRLLCGLQSIPTIPVRAVAETWLPEATTPAIGHLANQLETALTSDAPLNTCLYKRIDIIYICLYVYRLQVAM